MNNTTLTILDHGHLHVEQSSTGLVWITTGRTLPPTPSHHALLTRQEVRDLIQALHTALREHPVQTFDIVLPDGTLSEHATLEAARNAALDLARDEEAPVTIWHQASALETIHPTPRSITR